MKRFIVLENNKPAIIPNTCHWFNCEFETFAEAYEYMKDWLGPYGKEFGFSIPKSSILNKEYDYNGYGDTIMIKENFGG